MQYSRNSLFPTSVIQTCRLSKFGKVKPTTFGYFCRQEAVQMAAIKCFRARSTCCIAAEDTG